VAGAQNESSVRPPPVSQSALGRQSYGWHSTGGEQVPQSSGQQKLIYSVVFLQR